MSASSSLPEIEALELQPVCERKLHATRQRVDELLAEGWTIVGRHPLRLERGKSQLEVRSNGIIVGL